LPREFRRELSATSLGHSDGEADAENLCQKSDVAICVPQTSGAHWTNGFQVFTRQGAGCHQVRKIFCSGFWFEAFSPYAGCLPSCSVRFTGWGDDRDWLRSRPRIETFRFKNRGSER